MSTAWFYGGIRGSLLSDDSSLRLVHLKLASQYRVYLSCLWIPRPHYRSVLGVQKSVCLTFGVGSWSSIWRAMARCREGSLRKENGNFSNSYSFVLKQFSKASVRALQGTHMNCETTGLVRHSDKFRSPLKYWSTWVLPHSFGLFLANYKQWCWVVFKTMIFEAVLCSCFLSSTKTQEVNKTYNGQEAPENFKTHKAPMIYKAYQLPWRRDSLQSSCLQVLQNASGMQLLWAISPAVVSFSVMQQLPLSPHIPVIHPSPTCL